MQVNISSGREQKAGWFKHGLLSQGQAWASSNVAGSIVLLSQGKRLCQGWILKSQWDEGKHINWLLHTSCNFLQLQCHSALLCCEICSLRINLDLRNWEILYYNPSKWQLSCC